MKIRFTPNPNVEQTWPISGKLSDGVEKFVEIFGTEVSQVVVKFKDQGQIILLVEE